MKRRLSLADDERSARIGATLDEVRARCDIEARLARDPVGIVHRYTDPLDQEIVGPRRLVDRVRNVKTIRAKLDDALARLGPSPARSATTRSAPTPRCAAGSIACSGARTSRGSSSEARACSGKRGRSEPRSRASWVARRGRMATLDPT